MSNGMIALGIPRSIPQLITSGLLGGVVTFPLMLALSLDNALIRTLSLNSALIQTVSLDNAEIQTVGIDTQP